MANPFAKYAGQPTTGGDPVIAPPDPYKQAGEQRAQRDQQLQEEANRRAQEDQARQNDAAVREAARLSMAQDDQNRQESNSDFNNVGKLRDDFNRLPEVKSYRVAIQQLDQALRTGEGPQADLALTYAFAKAMDPDSVVREAEQGMVTNSQPWIQAQAENIKKQFGMDGAGNYTPEARRQIRQQIISAVISRRQMYSDKRGYFSDLAGRYGFDPVEVVGPDDGSPYLDRFRAYDQKNDQQATTQWKPGDTVYDKDGKPLPPDGREIYDAKGNFLGTYGGDSPPPSVGMGDLVTESMDPGGYKALAAQGMTFGLSDEITGIGGYLGNLLTGQDPVKGYEQSRDAVRSRLDRARSNSPVLGTAAEIIGGFATGGALKAPMTVGGFARQGATLGGVAGFGYGEGADSAQNALIGAGGGAALGLGVAGASNALARFGGKGATPDMEVIAAGRRQNIPVRQPDARPELRGRYAAAESGQESGKLIRQARAADQAAIENRVAEIGGAGNAGDPYAVGSQVQDAGKRYIAKTRAQADRLYKTAETAAGDARVTPTNADAVIETNLAELKAAGENSNASAIKYLEGLQADIDQGLSLQSVQNLRTNMRGQLSERGLTGTDTERRVKQVIDAMNRDLTEQLPQEASTALRAADDFYRQRQEFISGTLEKFMGTRGNPLPAETASQRLISMAQGKGNYERFNGMWQKLEPAEQADVAATIAASLGRKQNGDFSAAALIKSLDPAKGINPRTARLIFGKEGAEALADLRTLAQAKGAAMDRLSPSGQAIGRQAGGMRQLILSAFGFSQGGVAGAVAVPMATGFIAKLGEQRAARMLLNPDFTKWLKNAPNTTDPRVIDRYFGKLAGMSSVAANDNQAFAGALMEAFRRSPSSAAAQQESNSRREPPQ